ncbi:MAG TPA: Fic family protein [Terriglobia bacterium]|nr:Fic family protein [Terriglobia bacterium]
MSSDLPIYSDSTLRSRLQFSALEKLRGIDTTPVWEKSDKLIADFEGARDVRQAREEVQEANKAGLLRIHTITFNGQLRQNPVQPQFRGQDCPDPQFIDRSLDNFFNWLSAESISEIHPIERAALVLTRIADIWPFESGNLSVGIMLANVGLRHAGLAPFFVLPKHKKEFTTVIAQAMTIETQPLVNAIFNCIKREMEALASG